MKDIIDECAKIIGYVIIVCFIGLLLLGICTIGYVTLMKMMGLQ
jgi:hypothetical protein